MAVSHEQTETPGQATVATTLHAIDAVTEDRCACGCGTRLNSDGPSAWFATEWCQHRWAANRHRAEPLPVGWLPPVGAVNVLDYGAVGDGVTDDTAAIQRAINTPSPGLALHPADPHRDRIDLVCLDVHLNPVIVTGTPAEDPQPPVLPAGVYYALSLVHVPAGQTAVSTMPTVLMPGRWACPDHLEGRIRGQSEHSFLAAIEAKRNRNTGPKPVARAPRRIDPRRGR